MIWDYVYWGMVSTVIACIVIMAIATERMRRRHVERVREMLQDLDRAWETYARARDEYLRAAKYLLSIKGEGWKKGKSDV